MFQSTPPSIFKFDQRGADGISTTAPSWQATLTAAGTTSSIATWTSNCNASDCSMDLWQMLNENTNAEHHLITTGSLIRTILNLTWNINRTDIPRHFYLSTLQFSTEETYEEAVWAAMAQQYLSYDWISPPNSRERLPTFLTNCPDELILPRWGLILPRKPPTTPVLYFTVTHPFSRICTYTKHPQPHHKTPLFLAWTWKRSKWTTVWATWTLTQCLQLCGQTAQT